MKEEWVEKTESIFFCIWKKTRTVPEFASRRKTWTILLKPQVQLVAQEPEVCRRVAQLASASAQEPVDRGGELCEPGQQEDGICPTLEGWFLWDILYFT